MDPELEEPGRCNVQQVKEEECNDKKAPEKNSEPNMVGEEDGRGKDQIKEEELEDPVKQDMPQKAGWLRRKWRRWRNTEDPLKEVSRAENIVFSPPVWSNKYVRSQFPVSSTRLPHARGTETSPRLPHASGTAEPPDAGERGMGMGRGEQSTTLGAAPITPGIQTLVENMLSKQLNMDLRCYKEYTAQSRIQLGNQQISMQKHMWKH